jgi:hypothetical protein
MVLFPGQFGAAVEQLRQRVGGVGRRVHGGSSELARGPRHGRKGVLVGVDGVVFGRGGSTRSEAGLGLGEDLPTGPAGTETVERGCVVTGGGRSWGAELTIRAKLSSVAGSFGM